MAWRAIKSSSPFCAARAPKVQCHHGLTELVLKVLPYEHLLISATTLATMTTGHNVLHRRGGNQTRHQNRPSSLRRVNPFRRIDEQEVNLRPQSSEAWLACASGRALRAIKSSSPFCAARAPEVQCHHGLTELVLKVLPYEHLLISATTLATMTTGHNVLLIHMGNDDKDIHSWPTV